MTKEDKLEKIRENGGTIHLKAGTFNTFEEAIDRIELKEDKQTVRAQVSRYIDDIYVALGQIHADSNDITHSDLDTIRDQATDKLCALFAHEYQSLKRKVVIHEDWNEAAEGRNKAVKEINTLLDTKIQELQGGQDESTK